MQMVDYLELIQMSVEDEHDAAEYYNQLRGSDPVEAAFWLRNAHYWRGAVEFWLRVAK